MATLPEGEAVTPKWVFWSTRESINSDVPSISAILETVVAILLYWAIAIQFETYWPLLIGIGVAPFVLLRWDRFCHLWTEVVYGLGKEQVAGESAKL